MSHDRSATVKNMFAGIARRYDLANAVLSLGIYRLWYNRLIKLSRAKPEMRVLDCATGTGSLAIDFYVAKNGSVSVGVSSGRGQPGEKSAA
jgi:ubiquinone/menaquinone biosynthesis C-methylase UbiE